MKKNLLFCVLLLCTQIIFAKTIDENTAKIVGKNFLTQMTNSSAFTNVSGLQLAYKASSNSTDPLATSQAIPYFYVFILTNTKGFVIVSADDKVIPILGYSDKGSFHHDSIPQNVLKWLEGYKDQIRYAIVNNLSATQEITKQWQDLISGKASHPVNTLTVVVPLIQTQWSQSPNVNDLCPYDVTAGSANGYHAVTGCPATAMAQIMKYWNYPTKGTGFHSYNHNQYGTLSANFGSTSYDWTNMPIKVSSTNNAVATLMYHCGVAVEMGYGPTSSGSYVIISKSPTPQQSSEYAYKTYFGYDASTIQGLERVNYSDANWKSLLKGELDASRPIQYAGFGGGSGHTFVCDGYDVNNMFHMNWGWGGYVDGNFLIDALNPGGGGTGSGTGTFNQLQQAVIGISPPSSATYDLRLYNSVSPSPTTIYYAQSFTVSTNIANYGTNIFNGDYTAAIFDKDYNFVDFVQTLTGQSLQGGYNYSSNKIFSTSGLASMLPGTYYVAIFYRPIGGNWMLVDDDGSYSNFIQMDVNNPNDIEVYSPITISPSTLKTGKSASVNFNIANDGANTFYGDYSADLYDLNGNWVESLGSYTESSGLSSGYAYSLPLTVNTVSVAASPGTYLLAITHLPSGGSWELTGSSYNNNPIYVTVQLPTLQPDVYEVNNLSTQAYNLPITFTGNSATKNTQGSNCHLGADYDYYKINLPSGFSYTISARLHDSYNSGNGNTYSLDATFNYSTDGCSTWSDSYDDILPSNIILGNGGTVYFFASPYFIGQTGTYLLDINITRTTNPAPVPNFTISNSNICIGTCINFTDISTNSPTSWNWSFPGGTPSSSTSKTPSNICYSSSGSHNVTLTVTNSGGSNSTTKAITVAPNPTANAGSNFNICEGDTIKITSDGATNYSNVVWYVSNGSGTADGYWISGPYGLHPKWVPGVNDINSGSVILSMHSQNSPCNDATSTVTVNINKKANANAGANFNICQGDTIKITSDVASNYNNVVWYVKNSNNNTDGHWNVNGPYGLHPMWVPGSNDINSGSITFTMQAQNAQGCNANSIVTVNIIGAATANAGSNFSICSGDTIKISSDVATNYSNVVWYVTNSNGNVDGHWNVNGPYGLHPMWVPGTNDIISGTMTFTMQAQNSLGCNANSAVNITIKPTPCSVGLGALGLASSVIVSPNPTFGEFNVDIQLSQPQKLTIRLLDQLGQEIFLKSYKNDSVTFSRKYDVRSLSAGIYYLEVIAGDKRVINKLVLN